MSLLIELNGANMSDADVAYKILKEKRQPEYYKNLIEEVLKQKNNNHLATPQTLAAIHTQINLDHRFYHLGKGQWSLQEWHKGEAKESFNIESYEDQE